MNLPAASPIRRATPDDITALVAIEHACFAGDRLDRRRFRYLLTAANAVTLIDEHKGVPRGYLMLLFRTNSSAARIYSIATHPGHARSGVAASLLGAAEALARRHGYRRQRLEIRADNQASLSLFQQRGYQAFGAYPAYYHDGMDAVRLEKTLVMAPLNGSLNGPLNGPINGADRLP